MQFLKRLHIIFAFALLNVANANILNASDCSDLLQGFLTPISDKEIFTNRMSHLGFAAIEVELIESSVVNALIAEAGDPRGSFKIWIRDEFQRKLGREFTAGTYAPFDALFGIKKLSADTLKPFEDYIERIQSFLNSNLAQFDGVMRYSANQAMIVIEGPEADPILKREFHTHPTSEIDVLNSIVGPTTLIRHQGLTTTAIQNTTLVISGESRAKRLIQYGVRATEHASPLGGHRSSWRVFFFCSFTAHQ